MLRFTLENGSTLEFPVSFGPLHITMRSGIDFAHKSSTPGNFGIEISNTLPDTLDYCDYTDVDLAFDSGSKIAGYYPDRTPLPGTWREDDPRYPDTIRLFTGWYRAMVNSPLSEG